MAIKGVLDLQRRALVVGEIRIGDSTPGDRGGRKPRRLEKFRFTTPVEETAAAAAERLGGTPAPWDRRKGYWVVDTDRSIYAGIEVFVPPRGLAVDAWMEMWDASRCLRRCDGITEQRSGQPCLCPQPDDRTDPADVARAANERKRLAGLKPPQGCKPRTRINVAIPWLPGAIGVWRLNTGSANAAVETADTGEVLERARAMDVYLPALVLAQLRPGQDGHPYPVLTLQLRPSAEQIAQLPAGMDGMLAQLTGDSGPRALPSGTVPAPAGPPAAEHATAEPPVRATTPGSAEPVSAEQIAKGIPLATSRQDLAKLIERAKAAGVLDKPFWHVPEPGCAEVEENLRDLFDARWWELPGPGKPAPAPQSEPGGGSDSLFDDGDPAWGAA